jgi:hypothetical protein
MEFWVEGFRLQVAGRTDRPRQKGERVVDRIKQKAWAVNDLFRDWAIILVGHQPKGTASYDRISGFLVLTEKSTDVS